jgi:predicted ribosomally synthesized peptide with SipW-like signal peptide
MKKNIILALVVVAALVVAGTSGVFATWSDSETSMGNIIQTGAVDLKVNGEDDAPWGAGVPSKVDIECMVPSKWYGPYEVELWHAGQCTENSSAYLHFKDMCCTNIPPKVNPYPDGGSAWWAEYHGLNATTGYPCEETGDLKPEPELVAEFGGKVDCRTVPGIGRIGDNCSMKSSVEIKVTDEAGNLIVGPVVIGDLEGEEIFLFELEPCHARTIYLWFHLHQIAEEEFGHDIFPNVEPGEPGYMEWLKFNDWPSAALMKDKLSFSMEFDLVLWDGNNMVPGIVT